ncbi:formyl transferase [Ilyonectria robusta]|uniref:formyl transferase n=1 Tax=Ilyonectria robusta TaxID=1079257 RepID=UPI001E8E1798|nr:formyl transferase [Ilyonectria robusta]KAH6996720.1 formyl transferase [Ilyonectria sp. MPI-CAGE-AT-0026]KAH8735371.1 formyl transferase [Ilyonectria robusta]
MAETTLLVMASGNGSNLQAILDACADGRIPNTRVSKVIVNRKTAYATKRAELAGVPSEYFNLVNKGYHAAGEKDADKVSEARARYDADLGNKIAAEKPHMVVLAGWMHVFTKAFLDPLQAVGIPVINLHPALPGKYDGAGAISRAHADCQAGTLENGRTGVMVHYVIAEVDRGAPILVHEVECSKSDSLEDLETRIHSIEHDLLVRAVAQLVQSGTLQKTL